jgi:hypothetical protein
MNRIAVLLTVTGMLFVVGCGDSHNGRAKGEAGATPEQKQAGAEAPRGSVYGQESFILCTRFEDGPIGFGRGSYTVIGKQMAQGAVIVVAAKDGLEIRGKRFPYRQVVLIDETSGSPVPRAATPSDQVVLKESLDIFGKSYPNGRLRVPQDGMLPEQ